MLKFVGQKCTQVHSNFSGQRFYSGNSHGLKYDSILLTMSFNYRDPIIIEKYECTFLSFIAIQFERCTTKLVHIKSWFVDLNF